MLWVSLVMAVELSVPSIRVLCVYCHLAKRL